MLDGNIAAVSRFSEWWASRNLDGNLVFTAASARLSSVEVRGHQVVRALNYFREIDQNATFVRSRMLREKNAFNAATIVWVATVNGKTVDSLNGKVRQILDVINPLQDYGGSLSKFDGIIANSSSSFNYLPEDVSHLPPELKVVIPHHHCNFKNYLLSEDRIEKPRVVGYLGEPEHLHEKEKLEAAIWKMGMQLMPFPSRQLQGYKTFDLGIAFTNPDEKREKTRSNVKFINFVAHGIPCVVSPYESYLETDRALGGGTGLFESQIDYFIGKLEQLTRDEALRRSIWGKARQAQQQFGLHEITRQYRAFLSQ